MFSILGGIIHFLFYQPLFNILIGLYHLFGGNLGLAIIAIAGLAKLITIPITKKQLKSAEQMKVFQEESKKVKEKYAKNTEKMNEELMKLSSKYMPAQLGGCLPFIILIILLIQVRGVVINLVNQGYHAYNEVAYFQNFQVPEDSLRFSTTGDLLQDKNTIVFKVEATNGNTLEKEETFYLVENDDEGKSIIKEVNKEERDKMKELEKDERNEILKEQEKLEKEERNSEIAVYIKNFETGEYVTSKEVEFEAYLRAPSGEKIRDVDVSVNGQDIDDLDISKGKKLNFSFLGMNLSRVGADFTDDFSKFAPYLILALVLGVTQFVMSQIQMGTTDFGMKKEDKKKEPKKEKKKEPEEMDFSEAMQQSSKQMMYIMPIMTIFLSLGYLGGAKVFISAVSLFWTAQNVFVIIQLLISKRDTFLDKINVRFKFGNNKS